MKKIAALMLLLTSTVLRAESLDYYKWPVPLANQVKKHSLQAKVAGLNDPIPEGTANDLYPSDLQLVNAARDLDILVDSVVELHYLPSYCLQKKKEFSYDGMRLVSSAATLKMNNISVVDREVTEYNDDENVLYHKENAILIQNEYENGLLMKSFLQFYVIDLDNPLIEVMGPNYTLRKSYSYDEELIIDSIFAGNSYINFLYDNDQRLIREIKRPKNNQYDSTWHDVIYEYIEGDKRFQLIVDVDKYILLEDEGIFSAYDYSRETYDYQLDDQKRVIAMDYYLEYLLYGDPSPDEQYRINYQYHNDKMVYAEVCINPEPGNDENWFVQEKIFYSYYSNGLIKQLHETIFDERTQTWEDYKIRKYYYNGIDLESNIKNIANSQINVYPNPVKSAFTITGLTRNTAVYEILDLQGSMIQNGGIEEGIIDVDKLVQGYYLLRIIQGDITFNNRFVKLP